MNKKLKNPRSEVSGLKKRKRATPPVHASIKLFCEGKTCEGCGGACVVVAYIFDVAKPCFSLSVSQAIVIFWD